MKKYSISNLTIEQVFALVWILTIINYALLSFSLSPEMSSFIMWTSLGIGIAIEIVAIIALSVMIVRSAYRSAYSAVKERSHIKLMEKHQKDRENKEEKKQQFYEEKKQYEEKKKGREEEWKKKQEQEQFEREKRRREEEQRRQYEQNTKREKHDLEAYFQVLEVQPDASFEEIKSQRNALAAVWHPDQLRQKSEKVQKMATKKMSEINEAYEKLQAHYGK